MVLCWTWFCADPDYLQAALESLLLIFPPRRAAQLGATAGTGSSSHATGCDPVPGAAPTPVAMLHLLLHEFICVTLSSGDAPQHGGGCLSSTCSCSWNFLGVLQQTGSPERLNCRDEAL